MEEADALIIGSPIYFGRVSGEMAAFLDRLLFQYLVYSQTERSLFPKKIKTGFIYTMNVIEDMFSTMRMDVPVRFNEIALTKVFGSSETLMSFDTYQFDDYSKVVAPMFDPESKAKRRAEVFPEDCRKAFGMGARFTERNF